MFGNSFYRNYNYSADDNILVLFNELISNKAKIFITTEINKVLNNKFSYAKQYRIGSFNQTKIKLPIKDKTKKNDVKNIDFDFMEEFMKELENAKLKKVKEYLKENNLDNTTLTTAEKEALEKFENNQIEWGEFEYSVFFKLCKIKNKLTKSNLNKKGKYPVFSSESENNGIIGYTNLKPDFLIDANNKFYIIFGDHSRNFNISKQDFCVADNVKVLSLKKIFSIEILKFIISSWKRSIPNKGYSRHWSLAKTTKILLPIKNEKIDFDFMENFIKAVEKMIVKNLIQSLKL